MRIRQRALLSGVLGACASCLAKFALSNESPLRWIRQGCNQLEFAKVLLVMISFVAPTIEETHVCVAVEWVCRLICLVGMIITNAFMMGAFLEGMEESGSVAGAGLVTAANFGTSALLGLWLWNEQVHRLWFLGFAMVLCGAVLLSQVTTVHEKQKMK
jgi:drug/metabolite transporter (DMT)-like permease